MRDWVDPDARDNATNRYASPAAIKSDNLSQFEKHSPIT